MMHSVKQITLSFLLGIFLVSCSTVYQYGPGNLGTESRILLTPGNRDSIKVGHYISGRYSFNGGKGYNSGESSRYGEAAYNLGFAAKYLSCGIGAGAFAGSYEVEKFRAEPGWKDFFGVTACGQAALNLPLGPVNWRIIGLRGGLALENGALYEFRKRYRNAYQFNQFTDGKLIGNFGSYSELTIHRQDFSGGLTSSSTFLFGRENLLDFVSSWSLFLGYRQFALQYQLTGSVKQGQNQSLGLVFRFK